MGPMEATLPRRRRCLSRGDDGSEVVLESDEPGFLGSQYWARCVVYITPVRLTSIIFMGGAWGEGAERSRGGKRKGSGPAMPAFATTPGDVELVEWWMGGGIGG